MGDYGVNEFVSGKVLAEGLCELGAEIQISQNRGIS
jgi:hypothetical protein